MADFIHLLGRREAALELQPQDLGALLMEYFHSLGFHERRNAMRLSQFLGYKQVPEGPHRYEIAKAIIEGWSWLVREGLIVPHPDPKYADEYAFSRQGESLKTRLDVEAYRTRARFPKELLHSVVAEKAWPLYIRGDYDTAVFQAFKEVEVAVRTAGGYSDND